MGYTRRISKFELSTIILSSPFWRGTKSRASLMRKSWDELWNISNELIDTENERNLKAQSLSELSIEVPRGTITATLISDESCPEINTGISIEYTPVNPEENPIKIYVGQPYLQEMTVTIDAPGIG